MNSYKKGEDTATVVVLLLLILAAVWLWKNNAGLVTAEEQVTNQARVSSSTVRMDRQAIMGNEQPHAVFTKDSHIIGK